MTHITSEMLRHAMRDWTTGVAVVSSWAEGKAHGMTVNSFISVSLTPPLISVTMANNTRTRALVEQSGVFGITILAEDQGEVSNRFAGRIPEEDDRFAGLVTYSLASGSPLLLEGLVGLDCKVVYSYKTPDSTVYFAEVVEISHTRTAEPLVYHNRLYHRLVKC